MVYEENPNITWVKSGCASSTVSVPFIPRRCNRVWASIHGELSAVSCVAKVETKKSQALMDLAPVSKVI